MKKFICTISLLFLVLYSNAQIYVIPGNFVFGHNVEIKVEKLLLKKSETAPITVFKIRNGVSVNIVCDELILEGDISFELSDPNAPSDNTKVDIFYISIKGSGNVYANLNSTSSGISVFRFRKK
jgi:hypothetical protein